MLKDTIEKGLLNIEELIDPARKEEFEKIKQEINAHLTQNPVTQPLVLTPAPSPAISNLSDGSVNFFQGATLYKSPSSQIAQWLRNNATDSNFSLVQKLDEPTSIWLTGGTQDEVYKQVKTVLTDAGSKLVAFVVYNIPHRDNGGASAGGAADQAAYEAWIGSIDAAVKDAGNPKVIFIVEPDALGFSKDNYPALAMVKIAVDILTQNPNRSVYLDVPMWDATPNSMEATIDFMIQQDKLKNIRGYSLNTSGYNSDDKCHAFGNALVSAVGGYYIVDTSRNANGGVAGQWENVANQGLGAKPLSQPATATFDGNIWIKPPAESDGGTVPAGQLNIPYALELAKNSK